MTFGSSLREPAWRARVYEALGKKYFVSSILKLTGIVNRRIDDLAVALPQEVNAQADQVRPLLEEFKSGRG